VQSTGWWYNTDDAWPLVPDINGHIAVPPNALQVVPADGEKDIVERANKLYNRSDRTAVFPQGTKVEANIKWFFPYEELPQVARNYIERRAGRIFQTNIVASQLLYQFTKELEMEAFVEMERNQLRVDKPNWFSTGASTNKIFNRR
jgi:hypothetical protein